MAEREQYRAEREEILHVDKASFTSVAAPENASSNDSRILCEIRDQDAKDPVGAPATRKEVWSYYCYYAGNNGIGSFQ